MTSAIHMSNSIARPAPNRPAFAIRLLAIACCALAPALAPPAALAQNDARPPDPVAALVETAQTDIEQFVQHAEAQRQALIAEQNTLAQRIASALEEKQRLDKNERQLARDIAELEQENRTLRQDLRAVQDRVQALRINLDAEIPPALHALFKPEFDAFDTPPNQPQTDEFANLANRIREFANLANRILAEATTLNIIPLEAALPDGRIVNGTAAILGPVAFFHAAEADGAAAGWLVAEANRTIPAVLPPRSAAAETAIGQWIENNEPAPLPIDPSGGRAFKALKHQSSLWQHIHDGGFVMAPLLALGLACVLIVAIKLVHFRDLTHARIGGPVHDIVSAIQRGQRQQADALTKKLGTPLSAVLRQGVEHLDAPKEQLEELMYERMLAQQPRLERLLSPLAVFASTAPLLGLLGTVTGMIRTFRLITVYGTGNAQLLSDGISEALITTETGLAIAIPALLVHAYLSRRLKAAVAHTHQAAIMFVNGIKAAPANSVKTSEATP